MMDYLASIINAKIAEMKQMRNDRQRIARIKEADRRIQVREFDNMLCISLDGIPVVPLPNFDKKALSDARLTFFNYINR